MINRSYTKRVYLLVYLLFVICFIVLISFQIHSSKSYRDSKQAYVELLNFEERLLRAGEWLPWSDSGESKIERAEFHNLQAYEEYQFSFKLAWIFLALASLFFLVTYLAFRSAEDYNEFIAYTLLTVAACCLVSGVMLPMLEIGAYNYELNIPLKGEFPIIGSIDFSKTFEGRLYYYYQNKSVMQLIGVLLKDGNMVVAVCIILFSIILPFIKLTFSFMLLLSRYSHNWKVIKVFVYKIGKWSMADVFVAACFLAFLSFSNMNTGIDTESKTLIGLYFFLGYCVLSIVSSMFIERALKDRAAVGEA
jgi:hypothetical protein